MSKFIYILDAGHGVETKKKESPEWNDGTKLYEYEFNRNIVSYLSFMLRESGIKYHVLVDSENDLSLSKRVKKANEIKEDSIYISVHSNQFTDNRVNGFETHYYNSGEKYAKIFQKHIGLLGKDRGLKQSSFYVIKNTDMPAILTENGFYSNEKECKKLLTPEFQYQIAEAHFRAILEIENNNI